MGRTPKTTAPQSKGKQKAQKQQPEVEDNENPNATYYSDTSYKTRQVKEQSWEWVYNLFETNENFEDEDEEDVEGLIKIKTTQLHKITARPTILPYHDMFQGGSVAKGSELQVEIAEFSWKNVELDGSLIVLAENIMGSMNAAEQEEAILQYGEWCGRCRLQNVKISNKGVDWNCSENVYWQHKVHRLESVKIVLHGNAEFEAFDVVLEGNHIFEVPEGHCLRVTKENIGVCSRMQTLTDEMATGGSWYWQYTVHNSHVHLEMVEL